MTDADQRGVTILIFGNNVRVLSTLLVLASLASSGRHVAAQSPPENRKQIISTLLNSEHVASVSFAKVADGKTILAEAYGEQSPGMPVSTATLYNIASMSKPISAEVILRLASAGKLSLDEPMYPYWVDPDVAADPRTRLLTPRLALEHQTGFANWRRETGGKLAFTRDPGKGSAIPARAFSTSPGLRRRRRLSRSKASPKRSFSIRRV